MHLKMDEWIEVEEWSTWHNPTLTKVMLLERGFEDPEWRCLCMLQDGSLALVHDHNNTTIPAFFCLDNIGVRFPNNF